MGFLRWAGKSRLAASPYPAYNLTGPVIPADKDPPMG